MRRRPAIGPGYSDPVRPHKTFLEAERLAAEGDYAAASDLYRSALQGHPAPPPRWAFRASRALAKQGDLDAAVAHVVQAIEARSGDGDRPPAAWLDYLARLHTRRRDFAGAAAAWARSLDLSDTTTDIQRRLLARDAVDFHERRRVAQFLEPRYEAIRERAKATSLDAGRGGNPLFTVWFQGIDAAPPLVQSCHRQLARVTDRELIVLDDRTLPDFATLPASFHDLDLRPAARSDLIRLELLARHGGTWLDATVLVRDDFDATLGGQMASGFFAFEKRRSTLSSWLMATSGPDNPIVLLIRAALHAWWEERPTKTPYLVFHHIFAVLLELDEELRALWEQTPTLDYVLAHQLFREMSDPYDAARFAEDVAAAFVQKLTYKYDPAVAEEPTMLRHVLQTY